MAFNGHSAALWKKHYHAGVTGSYHGDMALAFEAISKDPECDHATHEQLRQSVAIHMGLEHRPDHVGRKWFCEKFGTPSERIEATA
jgi:hypothetical protein